MGVMMLVYDLIVQIGKEASLTVRKNMKQKTPISSLIEKA